MDIFHKKLLSNRDFMNAYVDAIVSNVRIVVLDDQYRVMWVNGPFCELVKYETYELVGKPISVLDFFSPDPEYFNFITSVTSSGNKWSGEVKSKAKDGTFFWVKISILPVKNIDGKVESYLVLNSDISATKKAMEEKNTALQSLLYSEGRYRALVEHQSDLISLCKSDGTRIFVNDSYCKFSGKSFDELIGTNMKTTVLKGVSKEMIDQTFEITSESPTISNILEIENSVGVKYWISLSIKGIFDTQGNLYEILTIGRDVTDLKGAELQKTNYINDLEKIAFLTSHHVRGPIATMLGLLELLRLNAIHTDKWEMALGNFKKCIEDLDRCVSELSLFIEQRHKTL